MKRFVLVSGDFTTHGGMDAANYYLASYLAELRDTAVHLVSFNVQSPLAEHANVTWHRVKKLFNSYAVSEGMLNRAGRAVASQIRGSRVIVNGGNCDWGDVNWVHYVHAAWEAPPTGGLPTRVRRAIQHRRNLRNERRILLRARCVIANSMRTREDLIHRVGVSAARISTVYYGVDSARFHPADGMQREAIRRTIGLASPSPVIAFIGALGDRRKGFDLLFDAWKILSAPPAWDAKLLVIGHGAELARWKQRAALAGFGDTMRFMGFRRDVPDLLRVCDALVAPTRYEAYGLGVHEAICCGIPALVSDAAGVAERYPADLSALLIPQPLTVDGLAGCLENWRQNRGAFAAKVAGFSTSLRASGWDRMSRQILERLESTEPQSMLTTIK